MAGESTARVRENAASGPGVAAGVASGAPETVAFGELLRRHRLAAGLTQEALAERAGISARAVTDLERGVNQTPRAATRRLLAAALRLSGREQAAWEAAARWRPRTAQPRALVVPPRLAGTPPVLGREPELGLLERHLARTTPTRAPLLLLAGEPGIGKSRLLEEAARLGLARGCQVLLGGCHEREGGERYAPVLNALTRHIAATEPGQLRKDLRGCAWLVRLVPEIGRACVESLPETALPPEHERRLIFDAVRQFLANVAGEAGTLLLLDDLQWARQDALDLVRSLAHAAVDLPQVPLRIVGAYRDSELPANDSLAVFLADLAAAGRAVQHCVQPLAPAAAAQLLDVLLDPAIDSSSTRESVLRRTGGVPFFLVSCAQAINAGAGGETGVPWTVSQSVRRRLAALPAQTRAVLRPAALLGRVVSCTMLAEAVGERVQDVVSALEPACRAHLVLEQSGDRYSFAHDIIREVVTADLPPAAQMLWHQQIADSLEAHVGREVPVEMLAYHYSRAEAWHRALPYLIRAGDAAASVHAYQDALSWYAQAVTTCDRLGSEAVSSKLDVLQKRGLIHLNLMRLADMRAEFDQMMATARQAGDRHREGLALVHRGTAAWMDHAFAEAEANWREALVAARDCADVRLAASLFLGHLCLSLGRQAEGRRWRQAAARVAAAVDDAYIQSVHGFVTSMPLWLTGSFDAAVSRLERYREVSRRSGQEILRLQHQWAEALARAGRGDYATALRLLREALDSSQRCGDALWQGRCLNTLGWIHGELQDLTTALELNRAALQAAQSAPFPDPEVESNTRLNLGDVLLGLGHWDQAAVEFGVVERVIRQPRPEEHWMLWRYAQHFLHSAGELWLARGQTDRALALADECLERAQATDSRKNVAKARRLRAQVFLARGEFDTAEAELGGALLAAERVGNPPQVWKTYRAIGDLNQLQGRADEALAAYRAALRVVDQVGMALTDVALRDVFWHSSEVRELWERAAAPS